MAMYSFPYSGVLADGEVMGDTLREELDDRVEEQSHPSLGVIARAVLPITRRYGLQTSAVAVRRVTLLHDERCGIGRPTTWNSVNK